MPAWKVKSLLSESHMKKPASERGGLFVSNEGRKLGLMSAISVPGAGHIRGYLPPWSDQRSRTRWAGRGRPDTHASAWKTS